MVKFNSTIFRTITDEATGATKSIGLFGKSFAELKNIINSVKTNGLSKASVVSEKDIKCIKTYNDLIARNVPHQQAMEQATKGASDATKQMIKNANGNTIALNKMTVGAKTASVAMNLLSIAMNMAIMWGISKLITAWDDYKEKLREVSEETAKIANESLSSVDSLLELRGQLEDDTVSAEDLTSAFREQMRTMGYTETKIDSLIQKYGGLSGAIDEATRKALENAKTEAFAAKTSSAKELETLYDGTNFWVHGKDSVFSVDKDILTGYEDLDKEIKSILENVAEYSKINVGYRAKGDSAEEIYAYYQGILEINQLINDYAEKENDKKLQNLDHGSLLSEVNEIINGLSEAANRYGDAIGIIHKSDAQLELADYLKENDINSKESFDIYINGIKESENYSEEYKNVLLEVANDAFPQFSAAAKDASDSLSDFPDEITVLNITQTVDQIDKQLKPALDSLGEAYKTIFEQPFNLENVDTVGIAKDLKDEFDELSKAGITINNTAYEDFVNVLSDTSSTADDVKNAFNELATAITDVSITGTEDFEVLKKSLSDLGVVNNVEVAFASLVKNKEALTEAGLDLSTATQQEIADFAAQYVSAENLSQAIQYLTYQKMLNEMATMDTTEEVSNLLTLAKNAGITGEAISYLTELELIYQEISNGMLDANMMAEYQARADELVTLIKTSSTKFEPKVEFTPTLDTKDLEKSAEEAAKAAKESLEATIDLYKAELDSGIIDYKTFLKKCNDLLEDARDKGIITTKEYWDYQKEVLESQKDIYQKVINASIRVYDKKIDSINTVIDALEKENDALEKQLDKYDSVISAVSKYIDTQKDLIQNNIDGVEAENDVIQDEIDGYDQLLKAVTLVIDAKREAVEADQQAIQDRIDALQEENDEAKKAYELEQAKYELERLRNSRTKKIYVEGQGYIYDVDHSAIRDQEENVADLELDATIDALEKEKELLNDVLEQLDKTEEKWQAIADALDNAKAFEKAKELLGDDFENIIIEGDDQSINAILNAYVDAQNKLEENNLLIEDYEKRIEQLEAIAEKWENTADIKKDTENEINAAEILGKEWSEDILADRAETYEEFCDKYLEIQSKITDNTSQIESLEEQIEIYEAYKQQWEDITSAYSNAQEDMYLTQVLGADAEADLLAGRIDTLENFKKEYLAIEQAIVDAAWNSANEQNKALASVGTGSTNGGGNITGGNGGQEETKTETETKYVYEVIDNSGESFGSFETRAKANSEKKRLGDSGEAEKPIHINTIEVPIKKYHKGLEENYVGENTFPTLSAEDRLRFFKAIGSNGAPPKNYDNLLKKNEVISILEKGELVLTEEQQVNFEKALRSNSIIFSDIFSPNIAQPNWAAFKNNNTPATTVTIGKIDMYEIDNTRDFAAELSKHLPNISVQYNGRH